MHYMVKRLTSESLRPVIELGIFPGCNALIDTGAEIPVWTGEESQLATMEGVHSTGIRGAIGGFGGTSEGNIYKMTLDFDGLYYIDMPIIANSMGNVSWHIILPATMFDGMRYTIDNIRKIAIFESEDCQLVRHLKLRGNDGNMYVFSQRTRQKESA